MSARTSYPGIGHGDRVKLTGESWVGFDRSRAFEVDDETFHRPVVYADNGTGHTIEWYLFPQNESSDFSVTKVDT